MAIAAAAALFTAGVASAVTTITVLGRSRAYTQRTPLTLALATLAAAVWATASGLHLLTASPGEPAFWSRVMWFGVATLGTLWFVFVLSYAGYDDLLTPPSLTLLSVEPAVVLVLVLSGDVSTPLLSGSELTAFGVTPAGLALSPRVFLFHQLYSVALALTGLGVLTRLVMSSRRLFRRQVLVVLVASAAPLAVLAAVSLAGTTVDVWLAPTSFAVSSGALLVGLYRYQLFDVAPVARDVVLGELRDGVVVVDSEQRIVEINSRVREVFDTDRGDLLGRPVTAIPGFGAVLAEIIEGERDREEFVVDHEGEQRFFEATTSPFDGQQASKKGVFIILRDITERRQTEAEFRALIENTRDLITVLDDSGTRQYCAPSYEHVLGYDPDTLVDRDALELVHPADDQLLRETLEALREDGRGAQVRTEYRIRHADGSWRTFEADVVNLLDDANVQGFVVNARDVTSRRRYEQRLRVLTRVLRHDIRNEVNVIQGYADLLLDEPVTSEAKSHAQVIRKKANTLAALGEQTRQIDYTLHETDGVEKPVELTEPIHDRLDEIQTEFAGAIIERDLPDEQWVLADDLIDSAVLNVIDNAIEHNDRIAPQITVSCEAFTQDGIDWVEVAVADNGPGIPEAERRVFAEGTETPLSHGSGLGLWLTEWIVNRSHGRLSMADNEPRGTVVCIRLHQASADETRLDPSTPPASND